MRLPIKSKSRANRQLPPVWFSLMSFCFAIFALSPFVPKVLLVGLPLASDMGSYVGAIGATFLITGLGFVLIILFKKILSLLKITGFEIKKSELNVSYIYTIIGFPLVIWYAYSYFH